MSTALMWGAALLFGLGVTCAFVYASSKVSRAVFDGDDDDDLVVANGLPPARTSGRVVLGTRTGGGAGLHAVPASQSGARRDDTLGVDQARAEVRERIRRYNAREVKRS